MQQHHHHHQMDPKGKPRHGYTDPVSCPNDETRRNVNGGGENITKVKQKKHRENGLAMILFVTREIVASMYLISGTITSRCGRVDTDCVGVEG